MRHKVSKLENGLNTLQKTICREQRDNNSTAKKITKSTEHFKGQITLMKQSIMQLSDVMVDEFEQLRTQFKQELADLKKTIARQSAD